MTVAEQLASFLTSVGTVVTAIIGWFTDVATELISNPLFMILVGMIVFSLLFAKAVGLAKGLKGGRKRR